jgi:hypothetical protein
MKFTPLQGPQTELSASSFKVLGIYFPHHAVQTSSKMTQDSDVMMPTTMQQLPKNPLK